MKNMDWIQVKTYKLPLREKSHVNHKMTASRHLYVHTIIYNNNKINKKKI